MNEFIEKTNHYISIDNRSKLMMTGVTDVDSFDENTILLFTQCGELAIHGKNLHINAVSVETGELTVEGDIWSIVYGDKDRKSPQSFLAKLFK